MRSHSLCLSLVALSGSVAVAACGSSPASSPGDGGGTAPDAHTGTHSEAGAADTSVPDASRHESAAPDASVDAPTSQDSSNGDAHDGGTDAASGDAHPACSPTCEDTSACISAADCESRVCTGGICAPPACAPTCANAEACGADTDCASAECASGKCVAPYCAPTCPDENPCAEDGDCGSGLCAMSECSPPACAPACADNAPCGANGDCGSGVCTDGVCVAPNCAPSCTAGNKCGGDGDCASNVCTNGVCAAAACAPTCADKSPCGANSDCGSLVCSMGKCAPPMCAPMCGLGASCGANTDCASLECTDGSCVDTANCAALLAVNPTLPSGLYTIDPDGAGSGNPAITVYCDMVTDGGGWTQVVDQDTTVAPGYQPAASWLGGINTSAPNSGQYSILNLLDTLNTGGTFELMLRWPSAPEAGSVIWTQVENPLTAGEVPTLIGVPVMNPASQSGCGTFRGLAPSSRSQPAALNGDSGDVSGCYWWAVGESAAYQGGIPSFDNGPQGNEGTPHTQLWVR